MLRGAVKYRLSNMGKYLSCWSMGNTMGKYMRYIINIYIHRFITYKACPWYTYLGTCCQWPHSFLTFGAGPGRPKTRGFTILVFRHRSMLLKVQSDCVKFCADKTESWPKLWGQMFISNPKLIFSYFFVCTLSSFTWHVVQRIPLLLKCVTPLGPCLSIQATFWLSEHCDPMAEEVWLLWWGGLLHLLWLLWE